MEEHSYGIVVFTGAERKYLVLHYGEGHWDFTKGHPEGSETGQQTALRECKEETGIDAVELIPGFQEDIYYYYQRRGKRQRKGVTFFLGRTESEKVTISHEHSGFEWLPYEEALRKVTFENAKSILEKSESFLTRGT